MSQQPFAWDLCAWGRCILGSAGHRRVVACFGALVLLNATVPATRAWAQVDTATLVVQVNGENSVALPGVTVEVTNAKTGYKRQVVTDSRGSATLPGLAPGTFDVSVSLAGMTSTEEKSVVLRVGQRSQLLIVMKPVVSEVLTVTSEKLLVDALRMDSSTNIIPQQIESLPVAERQFERLAFLSPGVQRDRTPYFDRAGAPVIASSSNSAIATILVDGVDFADFTLGQSRQRLSQDSIQEFRVVGQGFDAEVGGSAGGGLSVVTKSGTNAVHSTAFGYFRDAALRSQGALEIEDSDYSRYHLGFTIGGPIAQNRTHYFGAFEHVDEDNVVLVRPGGSFVELADDVVQPRVQTTGLIGIDHSFGPSALGYAKLYLERYRRDNYDVGGVIDESQGWGWYRDVATLAGGHTWVIGNNHLNELRVQIARRDAEFPANETTLGEWFTYGSTLQTGGKWLEDDGGLEGTTLGLRDTFHWQVGRGRHQLKTGLEYLYIDSYYKEDRFDNGLLLYETDTRDFPYAYAYGIGSSASEFDTNVLGLFIHDDWAARENLTVGMGLRYDLDTGSNLPDFRHPLTPDGREVDYDNLQPRFAFSWDTRRNGRTVVRGGLGRFVGRYNHYTTHTALMFNEIIGRTLLTRVSLPQFGLVLDPSNPEGTGYELPGDITLLASEFPVPQSDQARLGVSQQLWSSKLFLDVEAVYSKGTDEHVMRNTNWVGNDDPRWAIPGFTGWISDDYTSIDTATAEGRSRYKALTAAINGVLRGGHVVTAGLVISDKKNIWDDPITLPGPSDPADIEAEWGRSGTNQRYRFVTSGIFRLPWQTTLSGIYEYGSGPPWTRLLGYDYNLNLSISDRPAGSSRNDQDGPPFSQFDLMFAKIFSLGGSGGLELSIEVFNLFNTTNYDVNSVDNAMYFQGPLINNPSIEYAPNPGFGNYRSTLRPREVQLGLRWRY